MRWKFDFWYKWKWTSARRSFIRRFQGMVWSIKTDSRIYTSNIFSLLDLSWSSHLYCWAGRNMSLSWRQNSLIEEQTDSSRLQFLHNSEFQYMLRSTFWPYGSLASHRNEKNSENQTLQKVRYIICLNTCWKQKEARFFSAIEFFQSHGEELKVKEDFSLITYYKTSLGKQ